MADNSTGRQATRWKAEVRRVQGLGTAINVGAVILGSALGVMLGGRFPQRIRETVLHSLGALTMILGIDMALESHNFLIVMGAVLLGAITGEVLDIEKWLKRMGDYLESRLSRDPSSTFSAGFVTASLLFCIGPMAVVGSIQDGVSGDYSLLVTKAILDGFSAVAFAAALGWGVGFSAVSVLVYQGAITLLAVYAQQIMTDTMIAELTAAGGVLVLAIGLKLMEVKEIRVANLLPAIVYAPAIVALLAALP